MPWRVMHSDGKPIPAALRTDDVGRAERRLRILLLSQYFPPEVGATQSRMQAFAEHLAARGHEVTVICEFPNHPHGVIPAEYRGHLYEDDRSNPYRVLRVWVKASEEKTQRTRMQFYLSYMGLATAMAPIAGRADVVVATTPPLFTGRSRARARAPEPGAVRARRPRPLARRGGEPDADLGRGKPDARRVARAAALPRSSRRRRGDAAVLRARRRNPRSRAAHRRSSRTGRSSCSSKRRTGAGRAALGRCRTATSWSRSPARTGSRRASTRCSTPRAARGRCPLRLRRGRPDEGRRFEQLTAELGVDERDVSSAGAARRDTVPPRGERRPARAAIRASDLPRLRPVEADRLDGHRAGR